MTTYLIRRAFQGFGVLVAATVIIYFLLCEIPMAACGENPEISRYDCDARRQPWDLNKPWYERYLYWLFDPRKTELRDNPVTIQIGEVRIQGSGLLTGNWGRSLVIAPGQSVITQIQSRLPHTLILMVSALLVSLLLAFPIGVLSAMRQYSRLDYSVTMFSFIGISMPGFWFGLMLIILFAVKFREWGLPYLPTGDLADLGMEGDLANRVRHLILPVTVLSLGFVAGWSRYIRSSMLEVLRQDYVRTAWAKGLKQRGVILKHVLRNALIPLITIIGLAVPNLFSGAIIIETVFNYPGMGRLYLGALNYDWPLVMGILLIGTVLVIVSNMLADVLYAVADPRIRYS